MVTALMEKSHFKCATQNIFVVYEPILELQGLVAVEFQGKNCFKKMASNFSEIDCGFR